MDPSEHIGTRQHGGTSHYGDTKLHGKRLIERRLFFQPLQVHFPCVLSGVSAFVHFFLDPFKSFDKLLRFINVVSVSVYLFLSQGLQDVN